MKSWILASRNRSRPVTTSRRHGIATGAVTLALALTAAACSNAATGSAASSTNGSGGASAASSAASSAATLDSGQAGSPAASGDTSASSGAGATALANAKAQVAKYYDSPTVWHGPSSSPPPKQGARIAIISANQATLGTAIVAKDMQAGAALLGWKTTVFDGKGNPSDQLQAVESAVNSHYDGIILDIVDTRVIQEGVNAAAAAHIPMITLGDLVNEPASMPDVSHDWVLAGQLAAYYMIAHSPNGAANILVLADLEFPAVSLGEYKGIMSVLKDKTLCPNCKFTVKQFQSANIATQPASLTVAAIQSDPTINWVWCYDACMQQVSTGVTASGIKTIAHGVGMNGNPPNLDLIKSKNQFQVALIANPYPMGSWATLDNLNRILNHQPLFDWSKGLPLRIIDTGNIDSVPAVNFKTGWDGELPFEQHFKTLWGVS